MNGIFTTDPINFLVLMLFAVFGANLNLGFTYLTRNKSGRKAPRQFKLGFMFRDNWVRMSLSLGLIYASLRFGQDMIISFLPNVFDETVKEVGSEASLRLAFVVGWGVDILPHLFRRYLRFGDNTSDEHGKD
jgi:hypothetical protein